jgi:hypothetical protein
MVFKTIHVLAQSRFLIFFGTEQQHPCSLALIAVESPLCFSKKLIFVIRQTSKRLGTESRTEGNK